VFWGPSLIQYQSQNAPCRCRLEAFSGTNTADHQAFIYHLTTVTGLANTSGYSAMTNNYSDIRNSKAPSWFNLESAHNTSKTL
jgi:anaerobic selenocysteine-containing dehydrogenase